MGVGVGADAEKNEAYTNCALDKKILCCFRKIGCGAQSRAAVRFGCNLVL